MTGRGIFLCCAVLCFIALNGRKLLLRRESGGKVLILPYPGKKEETL